MKQPQVWATLFVLVLANGAGGDDAVPDDPVENAAAKAINDAYRNVDADAISRFPIGVFDSGTGGLTVLETILTMDAFENSSHTSSAHGDGQLDFNNESFIFLADQANMPYGNSSCATPPATPSGETTAAHP
ncbi:MAG: hypothetical protein ACC628_02405 [Pirellulaceae bacterium]